ncbi:MAG: DNA-processing protein DprA [Candidatus Poribacteria bacterium]|nr:DNA-processing protein DprA [Candidatus Poribacteria bacterium]
MLSQETTNLLHLNLIQGIGPKTVQFLIKILGSAEKVLSASSQELQNIEGLAPTARERLIHKKLGCPLERELELIHEFGCQIVTFYDAAYPPLLKEIDTPPLILYVRGELKPEDALSIALVGSRQAKDYGRRVSYQLSYQLAKRGLTVISGFAKGIDTCAHRGALEAGGRTIAVMGNGLSLIYPAANSELVEKVIESGALVSEFPMGMKPRSENFPRRNRIISGLTLGTVVVEASNRSGALITARLASEQGREVFAVPGEIFSELSTGTHKLIDNGAKLISTVDDLLEALPQHALRQVSALTPGSEKAAAIPEIPSAEKSDLNQTSSTTPKTTATEKKTTAPVVPPPDLTTDEKTVFNAIEIPSSHIDAIVRTTQLPISQVSSVLLMLELKGAIEQLPGKQFTKTSG